MTRLPSGEQENSSRWMLTDSNGPGKGEKKTLKKMRVGEFDVIPDRFFGGGSFEVKSHYYSHVLSARVLKDDVVEKVKRHSGVQRKNASGREGKENMVVDNSILTHNCFKAAKLNVSFLVFNCSLVC